MSMWLQVYQNAMKIDHTQFELHLPKKFWKFFFKKRKLNCTWLQLEIILHQKFLHGRFQKLWQLLQFFISGMKVVLGLHFRAQFLDYRCSLCCGMTSRCQADRKAPCRSPEQEKGRRHRHGQFPMQNGGSWDGQLQHWPWLLARIGPAEKGGNATWKGAWGSRFGLTAAPHGEEAAVHGSRWTWIPRCRGSSSGSGRGWRLPGLGIRTLEASHPSELSWLWKANSGTFHS